MNGFYFVLTIVFILILTVIGLFIVLMKTIPKIGIVFESIGYVILLISLGWSFFYNITNDQSTDTEFMIINEQIDLLLDQNKDFAQYLQSSDIDQLQKSLYEDTNAVMDMKESIKDFKKQDEIIKNINYALVVISAILIACGRMQELFTKKKNKGKKNKM